MDDGGRHVSLAPSTPWSARSTNPSPPVEESEEEACVEPDDPPENSTGQPRVAAPCDFQKTSIRKPVDGTPSLLTKALLSQYDDNVVPDSRPSILSRQRRRSMTSNISMTSTADLTSDTGLTSPSRDNTPSPPLPEMRSHYIHDPPSRSPRLRFGHLPTRPREDMVEDVPRKKSITFACVARPENPSSETTSRHAPPHRSPTATTTAAKDEFPRKPRIKFACPPPRTSSDSGGPKQAVNESSTSSAIRRYRSPRPPIFRRPHQEGQHQALNGGTLPQSEVRLEEPVYDEPREDDWIREEDMSPKRRITIDDILVKENHIRQLAEEAEEEDDEEDDEDEDEDEDEDDGEGDEDDDDDDEDGDEDDDDDDEDDDDGDDDGDFTEYGSVEADDGYHTDEETGFAESDEDEEDGLNLWNNVIQPPVEPSFASLVPGRGPPRRPSATDHHSDSSTAAGGSGDKRRKPRHIFNRPVTPELPDSTDFVCGTFDEDRPVEEAYILRRAAFEARKVHLIPQDIDPSFPTSDVEDGDEELFNPVHQENEDEMWEMEDVQGDRETSRKKAKGVSPSRRYHSPPPKPRGRSPRLFDKHSPRRMRSPRPKRLPSAGASPTYGVRVNCGGAGPGAGPGVGLTQTKSLPRPAAMLTLIRHGKKPRVSSGSDNHVRGAIDIVRGLEHKRQRRKEKFYQKYCNRARKGQIPERKALPGMGATKMRELGLLMAGKTDRGNYVMSI